MTSRLHAQKCNQYDEMLTLYVHQAAKSTFQSCRWISTLPTACAKSQPTTQPWKCMRYSIRCTSHNCKFITPKCALSSLKQPYMTSYCVWCDTKVAWTCSLTQTVSKLSAHTSGRRIFRETSLPPPRSLSACFWAASVMTFMLKSCPV